MSNSTKKPKKKGSDVAIGCLSTYATVRTVWRISHKGRTFISSEQKRWKNDFYVSYDSNYRSDSCDRVSSDLTLFATYDDVGERHEFAYSALARLRHRGSRNPGAGNNAPPTGRIRVYRSARVVDLRNLGCRLANRADEPLRRQLRVKLQRHGDSTYSTLELQCVIRSKRLRSC